VISTSLSHIAHTLILASHYLAVRLPAEITLPHRDYPSPTIFNIAMSYHHEEVPFIYTPGASNTTLDEPGQGARVARPRPLFIDKPLPQLSKEDPATCSYFLEGVTLLAYNIAWLCCSQGTNIGDRANFDDICNMGRNLYNLLISQQPRSMPENLINQDAPLQSPGAGAVPGSSIGYWSHSTSAYFLGSANGTELIKSFKLPSPVKLADKLKKKLIGDLTPDWEVLENEEWKTEDKLEVNGNGATKSGGESPKAGSGGWMKLKPR
jgi:hypothetical protein